MIDSIYKLNIIIFIVVIGGTDIYIYRALCLSIRHVLFPSTHRWFVPQPLTYTYIQGDTHMLFGSYGNGEKQALASDVVEYITRAM